MSNGPEDFEKLQHLLKLKRHELPPPGYFNNFSTKVVSRIESEEDHNPDTAWLRKFMALLETNPIAAGLFGISVCGLLISGIAYSQYQPALATANATPASIDVADAGSTGAAWARNARADSMAPSVNPMFSTNVPGSLFGGMEKLAATPVNFSVSP